MKAIRITSLVLATLLILLMAGAIFLPSSIQIERSVEINRPVSAVYPYVADYSKWTAWNPWLEREPAARNTYSEPGRGEGASWSWEGTEIGKGSFTTVQMKENEYLQSRITFIEPWENEAKDSWEFTAIDEQHTLVSWKNEFEIENLLERYYALFLEFVVGEEMEEGLMNLKQLLEEKE